MRRALIATAVVGTALAAALAAGAATTASQATKLEANLRGAKERPAAPRTNRGTVELRITQKTRKVCWEFSIGKIDGKPMQAHNHIGGAGVAGNVVVPLGANYSRQGCTTASKTIVNAILKKPGGYYVNVHNAKHPLGAMRGQLVRGA